MNSSDSIFPPARRLEGKVAIITGGASGIGASTARLFIQHGAKVLIADIQDELGQSLAQQLGPDHVVSYVHCDVTLDSQVRNAVDLAVSKYGRLDIMFNNAGVGAPADPSVTAVTDETFKKIMEVNVFGGFLGAKHAARVMVPANKGCILFTSSMASVICCELPIAYTASKHAVVGLAKSLCVELGKYGIRVNCVSPSGIATPLFRSSFGGIERGVTEELVSSSGSLKGVVLAEEDIAQAALYLASDDAKYVSGVNLVVDGGYSVTNPSFGIAFRCRFSALS